MGLKIRKLISLATPICLDYLPDLRQIGILHNVISLADIIQGPASYIGVSHRGDGRTLADSQRVINHLATRDQGGSQPSHSELHDLGHLASLESRSAPLRPRLVTWGNASTSSRLRKRSHFGPFFKSPDSHHGNQRQNQPIRNSQPD